MPLQNFDYAALYDVARLPLLDEAFIAELRVLEPTLASRFEAHRSGATLTAPAESTLLIEVAAILEDYLARAFGIEEALARAHAPAQAERVIHSFQETFVRPRAKRPGQRTEADFNALHARLLERVGPGDPELEIARWWQRAQDSHDDAGLTLLEDWLWAALHTDNGRAFTQSWVALKLPARVIPLALVATAAAAEGVPACQGPGPFRERDGFDLTDNGAAPRAVMAEVHYCVYCHERESDFCTQGFVDRASGLVKHNALGVPLSGCPLNERISEAHMLVRDSHLLGALAVIMIDNPLLAATGHRICNDCMKSCIYQKQDPVQIPQIETHILDAVLALPYGFEMYFLLTRWNPLNRERPFGLPFQGRKVLCVGAGPAGFTLSYHLLQAGFGVALVDGLKIEPLPADWIGSPGTPPQPICDVRSLYEPLDTRLPRGFGGVAEYGITVRWNKNYLTLLHIILARHAHCSITGGLRFGGTLTFEDAWNFGFDHVALAVGAGKPAVLEVPDGLAQGVRAASDFLMALQLTGAARLGGLANLQVRLPAVVIGGGLTAIDAATELQAYYLRQVEQFARRHEQLLAAGMVSDWEPQEADVAAEYLRHGHAVMAERARAAGAGEAPRLQALIRAFGGVTVAYRRAMHESPAYTRNHEEISKALEEGIFYAEALNPTAVVVDTFHRVCAVRFDRQRREDRTGRWQADGEVVELPARTVLVAAGSVPNTVYAREHPGSLLMDGNWFAAHRLVADGAGDWRLERATEPGTPAFYTSHSHDQHFASFHGDMHPAYHGSVVKAMASGADGARVIVQQFEGRHRAAPTAEWQRFAHRLERELRPVVQTVEPLGSGLTRLIVRAPQAARNWRPGNVYRLQNYADSAARLVGTSLQMEGVALDATEVNSTTGDISLIMNSVGASTRIASQLRAGEPVVLMGPGSAAAPMPIGQSIVVMGGHSAATSLLDSSSAWRARGNRIAFIGHFAQEQQAARMRAEVSAAADRSCFLFEDKGLDVLGVLAQFLGGSGTTPPAADWIADADLLLVSDDAASMKRIADTVFNALGQWAKPTLVALAAVNSPMQCMMKEVCAQCLCRHQSRSRVGAPAGAPVDQRVVFSCFNHHQPLFTLDCDNLRARQTQNSVQEKQSRLWLQYIQDCARDRDPLPPLSAASAEGGAAPLLLEAP